MQQFPPLQFCNMFKPSVLMQAHQAVPSKHQATAWQPFISWGVSAQTCSAFGTGPEVGMPKFASSCIQPIITWCQNAWITTKNAPLHANIGTPSASFAKQPWSLPLPNLNASLISSSLPSSPLWSLWSTAPSKHSAPIEFLMNVILHCTSFTSLPSIYLLASKCLSWRISVCMLPWHAECRRNLPTLNTMCMF